MTDTGGASRSARRERMRRLFWQFARFVIVGGISFAFDFGLYYVLFQYVGVQYIVASTISFSLSLVLNYFLTLKFVFEAVPGRNIAKEFVLYVGLNLIALGLNQLILFLTVDALGASPVIGKLIATAVVLIYNFISRKLLIERPAVAAAAMRSSDGPASPEAGGINP